MAGGGGDDDTDEVRVVDVPDADTDGATDGGDPGGVEGDARDEGAAPSDAGLPDDDGVDGRGAGEGPGRHDGVGEDEDEDHADDDVQPMLETDEPCNSRVLDLLFRSPPRDEQVLVPGEKVLYKRRQHGAMLAKHAGRALALVWLSLQVTLGAGAVSGVEVLLTLVALGVLVAWGLRRTRVRVAVSVLAVLVAGAALQMGRHGLAVVLLVTALGYFGKEFVHWRCYKFLYVTDRRVIQTRGIFNRSFATMPMAKITDVRLLTTYWGDVFDFAEFFIESAGQDQALGHLTYLEEPQLFSTTVLRLATNTVSLEELGY